MSSTGGAAKLLDDAAAAARSTGVDQVEQLGLELGEAERAIADAAAGDDAPDQLGLPAAAEILELQRELDCDVYAAVREYRRRQGKGGRKLGSGNRRNAEFRAFILAQGGHPGVFLQRVMDRPVELLAAELGCDKRDALDRQIRCATELMPYVEGKMPVNVNVAVRGDFSLVAGAGTGLFDGLDDGESDELPMLGFAVENAALSEGDRGESE